VINFGDDRQSKTQISTWLDTVPASKIVNILGCDINEAAISRLRSSSRIKNQFHKIVTSRIAQSTGSNSSEFNIHEDAPSSTSPAATILLSDAASATKLARIIGAQIHGASLRQLITKSETEDMEQWLGRGIFVFALRQSQNVPNGLVQRNAQQNLTDAIQNDGLMVLSSWVKRQNSSNRTKIELLHGDILTNSPLNSDQSDKIGSVLSDSLVQEAASAYAKLNS
jgi:hypothetical protein